MFLDTANVKSVNHTAKGFEIGRKMGRMSASGVPTFEMELTFAIPPLGT